MVIFNELAPDALTVRSSVGVVAPERMPWLSPNVPEMSAGESKPTHLRTPGCEHLISKLLAPGGGVGEGGAKEGAAEEGGAEEGGAEAAELPPEPPPPPPLQAATAKTSAQSERFLMGCSAGAHRGMVARIQRPATPPAESIAHGNPPPNTRNLGVPAGAGPNVVLKS